MGVMAKQIAAASGQPDPEDAQEPPEQPGEPPDPEDQNEPPEDASGAGADTGSDGGGDGNVSPEEQSQYEAVVIAADSMLYGKGTSEVAMQRIKASHGDPKDLGHLAAMIVMSVKGGAERQGTPISDDVLFAAGQEVVANIVELAVAAGLVTKENEPEVFKQTVFEGLKAYGDHEQARGAFTPQVRQQASTELEQLKAAHGGQTLGQVASGAKADTKQTAEES